jgi:hypothetical protein
MEARKQDRQPSNIPELIKRTKCEQKTCPNHDHNCLVMPGQKHFALTANDFNIWDKAIQNGKATIDLPPLNIRGTPVSVRKSSVAISQQTNNTGVQFPFAPPFPFMGGYPMPAFPQYPQAPPPQYPQAPPQYPQAPPPQTPVAPQTPVQYSTHGIFSSPMDTMSAKNNDVDGFMNWMITRAGNKVHEVEALLDARDKFIVSMQDLATIRSLNGDDYSKLGIPDGLGKHLSRDVKKY